MPTDRLTVEDIRNWNPGRPLLALTAYDHPTARHLDGAGVEILHVGDTLGMVVLGFEDTTPVTMEDMVRATGAVARGRSRALITADLPFQSYGTPELALANSRRLVDAGADAVKMEGGAEILPQIQAVLGAGIAVQGHLGMLPQHVREEGAYRRKGKLESEASRLENDARLLAEAGVFSLVLECIVPAVADHITLAVTVPTLGIASGYGTTGQIRVVTDLTGATPWLRLPYVEAEFHLDQALRQAVGSFRAKCASARHDAH
ncbi:MAG: 3-methyl-2-oxobutanoate hydroxymethyltransferase [Candidatus Methylacidiphilales bacterium]|nr:3-methyl-2-oxobutanoate hydroxymethyltransferase [Candidatus Methylacidiphilales bacterium]